MNKLKKMVAVVLFAVVASIGSYTAYAVLASACDNHYEKEMPDGTSIDIYLSYNEDTGQYSAQITQLNEAGVPYSQTTYNDLSENIAGNYLDMVFDPNNGFTEEA